jgi:hypothetical protein
MRFRWDFNERKQSAIRTDWEFIVSKSRLISAEIGARKTQEGGLIAGWHIDIGFHSVSRIINP